MWWLNPDATNSAVLQSLEALKFLLFCGPHAPYKLIPSMLTTLRAWGAGLKLEHYPKDTHTPRMPRCGATPIWPNSTRFQSLTPGPNSMWKRLLNWLKATPCFHYLSFNLKFTIPGSHFFRYLQLSHAFSCQFSHSNPQLIQPSLEDVLRLDCIKKKIKKQLPRYTLISLEFPYQLWKNSGPVGSKTSRNLMVTTSGTFHSSP